MSAGSPSPVHRGRLIAVLVIAVVALVGSVAAVAAGAGFGPGTAGGHMYRGFGPGTVGTGMMGGGPGTMGGGMMGGPGMMGGYGAGGSWMTGGGFGLAGDGKAVTTPAQAKTRAQAYADRVGGLHAGEVMQFSNGYYSELLTADGKGATEVLIDPGNGAVGIEYGPAMMWNTRYGMHSAAATAVGVSADQAVKTAQAWLDAQRSGSTAADATAFPGYYTLHVLKSGKIVGMMSVNATSGAVWYHTWHGRFITMIGA